jgi:hypothetical protein
MAYVCEVVDTATNVCLQWSVYSPLLPEMSGEASAELIRYFLKILVGTFIVIKVIQLVKR